MERLVVAVAMVMKGIPGAVHRKYVLVAFSSYHILYVDGDCP